ncbi:MAG: 2-C-methyl-D-erythritol 4-phosphate cytidylyltransferase [Desulfovibrionaceae bacterium]|nr:2-C-methyl-D-erythritol 4-phosphate cytidylyltransferase [Desulfovibrionaceae bacterium]
MNLWAVLLAAGSGTRLAQHTGGIPKQFLQWKGMDIYQHAALALARCPQLRGLVFVFPPDMTDEDRHRFENFIKGEAVRLPHRETTGGARRQDSVRNGLLLLPPDCTHVMIHDAARPFVPPDLLARLTDALVHSDAVIPGIPVTDTVKMLDNSGHVAYTPNRSALRAVQTPQAFTLRSLMQAHEKALKNGMDVTDDAMLIEQCGGRVLVIDGDPVNKKITTPEDLSMLEEYSVPLPCVGYGYDVHRYAEGHEADCRPLRLGGEDIPGGYAVLAHSDGDVLLHALADALLGCAGEGDIGQHFPDSDPTLAGCSSAAMLVQVLDLTRSKGLRPIHADLTIIAQEPKLGPHKERIRQNIARLMALPDEAVNVKATTEERLGFTGQLLGIKAVAVVTMLRHTVF